MTDVINNFASGTEPPGVVTRKQTIVEFHVPIVGQITINNLATGTGAGHPAGTIIS